MKTKEEMTCLWGDSGLGGMWHVSNQGQGELEDNVTQWLG